MTMVRRRPEPACSMAFSCSNTSSSCASFSGFVLTFCSCAHMVTTVRDDVGVAPWREVELSQPDFAQRVRELFDARRHKTIATLRADGSPRISGIEARFEDGELTFGAMPNARKGAD